MPTSSSLTRWQFKLSSSGTFSLESEPSVTRLSSFTPVTRSVLVLRLVVGDLTPVIPVSTVSRESVDLKVYVLLFFFFRIPLFARKTGLSSLKLLKSIYSLATVPTSCTLPNSEFSMKTVSFPKWSIFFSGRFISN